jgi:hypothetical protein
MKWGGRIHRHHALANVIVTFLKAAHHNPSREKTLDGRTRPGDVFAPHWKLGQAMAMDLAVTHPLQPSASAIAEGDVAPGSWAAAYAETHKYKFAPECAKYGCLFEPLVVETYGAWDPDALPVLHEIADKYATHQSCDAAYAFRLLMSSLSVTLQRQNVRMLLARSADMFADEGNVHNEDPVAGEELDEDSDRATIEDPDPDSC